MRTRWAILAAILASACASTRDYTAPKERIIGNTAYTLDDFDTELGAGLVGLDLPDKGLGLGVRQGLGGWADVRLNLGHATFGILTAGIASTLIDTPSFALGLDVAVLLARPKNIWVLPSDTRDELADLSLLVVPARLTATFPINDWLTVSVRAGFDGVSVRGTLETDSEFLDGGGAARQLYVDPVVHAAVGNNTLLFATGHLPYWARGRVNAEAAQEIAPGVRAGVVTAEWAAIPRTDLFGFTAGAEWWWDNGLLLRLAVTRGLISRSVVGSPVLPSVQVAWRF